MNTYRENLKENFRDIFWSLFPAIFKIKNFRILKWLKLYFIENGIYFTHLKFSNNRLHINKRENSHVM